MGQEIPRVSPIETEILELLVARGEMFGLQMVEVSDKLKQGTIYVMLHRMVKKGLVTARKETVTSEVGPPRRLYRVTGLGETALHVQHQVTALLQQEVMA
jgi:DNA-binding PadR family transcriptional regulator